MRSVLRVPGRPTGKEGLSAALTVSHVLKERLVIKLVRKSLRETTENHIFNILFSFVFHFPPSLSSLTLPGSLHCERCPADFWSNVDQTVCIPRQLDFLSFNETLGITLTTAAVSGAVVTAAVFVVFLYYRQTPMVKNIERIKEFEYCFSLFDCLLNVLYSLNVQILLVNLIDRCEPTIQN